MALPLLLFLYNNLAFADGNHVCYVLFMPIVDVSVGQVLLQDPRPIASSES